MNTTSRPWRSAPPSPPPGTRNTGTPTHPRSSLTPVPPFFLIPLPRSTLSGALSPPLLDSPLHTLTSDHRCLITSPCCPSSPPHHQPTSLNPTPPLPALGLRSASLLSLQTELLLDLVAEAQSRRLEEQRATFHAPQNPPSLARAPPRPLEDREQLYSTILSHQVRAPLPQEARSRLPGFSALLVLFGALPLLLPRPLSPPQALVPPSPSQVSCMPLTAALPAFKACSS